MFGGRMMGLLGVALVALSTTAGDGKATVRSACEQGLLDAGQGGMNVLVYELCPDRLTVGFRNSDVIEEMSCRPDGEIRLWTMADHERCAAGSPRTHELWEPLQGVGRTTATPVRKLLTCPGGEMDRATVIVPEARNALLETRSGDTTYEQVTRRFISQCIRPDAQSVQGDLFFVQGKHATTLLAALLWE